MRPIIHPEGSTNVFTKFHGDQYNICWDISLKNIIVPHDGSIGKLFMQDMMLCIVESNYIHRENV